MAEKNEATAAVPSFTEAAKESGMPIHVDREYIAALGPVDWYEPEPSEATNPQTGVVEQGLLAHITGPDGQLYTMYCGNVILQRNLEGMKVYPFRARLVKKGRAWAFAD